MRKKINHFYILIFFLVNTILVFADEDCDLSLKDAKTAYNAGQYQAAKDLFVWVKDNCGSTYTATADSWIQKCDQAMNDGSNNPSPSPSQTRQTSVSPATTLSASKTQINVSSNSTTEYITIYCNKSWHISQLPDEWCGVINYNGGIALSISESPFTTFDRTTSLIIKTDDGQKNLKIDIKQYRRSQSSSSSSISTSSSSSNTATLSLSKTSISASAAGTSVYITVTSNRDWEIQYPSGTMYSVEKVGSTQIHVVINRNTGGSRADYFNIKTTDGSKTVKVSLSQSPGSSYSSSSGNRSSSSNSSSYRNNTRYYSTGSSYTALRDFNYYQGKWEIDWFSMRVNLCTGAEFEASAFGVRYSVLKIEPLIFGWKYNFINEYSGFYYQPDVKLVFPWNSDCAFELGAGPSINFSSRKYGSAVWFTTELGILYHWGDICSSDFFMRYDGMFVFGVSINFSSGF